MMHFSLRTFLAETSATPLVAHQGGWDEILLVAGPIAVIVGLLAIVKRRIDARFTAAALDQASDEESTSSDIDGDSLDSRADGS